MAKTKTPQKKKTDNDINDNVIIPSQENTAAKDSSAAQLKKEKLAQDGSFVEIPDVSDIPGQENITSAGVPGEMADTTIASDDEEGISNSRDIFVEEEDDDTKIVMGTEADVTAEDLALLGDPDKDMDMSEDELIDNEGLDDTDADGDPLNEAATGEDSTGDDLDVPEGDDDNIADEDADEENKYYSLGGDDKDALNEGKQND